MRGRPFTKGDSRIKAGPGRPKGKNKTKAQREADAVLKQAAALTATTLEKIRAEIADMDAPALAQWAARPALRLLIEIVNDLTQPLALRMQAARDLLTAGWHKAPTKIDATIDGPESTTVVTVDQLRAAAAKLLATTAPAAVELPLAVEVEPDEVARPCT